MTRTAAVLLAVLLAPGVASAQGISERRVRSAVEDAARGIGQAVAGGSPLTAPAAPTGGLGHVQVGVSANLAFLTIQDPGRESGGIDLALPVATVNAAVGLRGGGRRGLGAVDVIGRLGSVLARKGLDRARPVRALGLRVGILGEGALLPAVSVSALRSWVDDLGWGNDGADEVSYRGDVRAWSLRAEVSKRFVLATPYAGVGLDRTSIRADYRIPASRSTSGEEIAGRTDTAGSHARAYVGAELGLPPLSADLEVGHAGGGSFAAFGLRLGL